MTRDFWDTQLKFSQILPDFDDCLRDMAARSASFATRHTFQRIPYGADPRQWVEVIPGRGSMPLLPVVIHGGYWRALTAETHRIMMAGSLPLASHVANLEYRLMPHVRLVDVVADCVSGLNTLAQQFPDVPLVLIGHSAGAHLALSALSSADLRAPVLGAVAISGIYELWPVAQSFLQDDLNLGTDEVAAHSLNPVDIHPPVLCLTGAHETPEFQRQSARMALGARTLWQVVPDTHHLTVPLVASDAQVMADAFKTLTALGDGPT